MITETRRQFLSFAIPTEKLIFTSLKNKKRVKKLCPNFWWDDINCFIDIQESFFVKLFSKDNFQNKEVIWSQKNVQNSKLVKI